MSVKIVDSVSCRDQGLVLVKFPTRFTFNISLSVFGLTVAEASGVYSMAYGAGGTNEPSSDLKLLHY